MAKGKKVVAQSSGGPFGGEASATPTPAKVPLSSRPSENDGTGWKKKTNIVLHLDALQNDRLQYVLSHSLQIKKSVVKSYLPRFEVFDVSTYAQRVTSITWNPNQGGEYTLGAGDKWGNLLVLKGYGAEGNSRNFTPIFERQGVGVGGGIQALKFQTNEDIITASLTGQVLKMNMTANKDQVFFDTKAYEHWFTALDLSSKSNTVIAGDTGGDCHLFSAHGEPVTRQKVHKGKVLHCEYNLSMPNLIATSGLDRKVKIFDLRKFTAENCLHIFEHNSPVNIARFSPQNGSRLLTSDQNDEIRVYQYQGPTWKHALTIKHPHRQFQYITPIKASWHPLSEAIIMGTFPTSREKNIPKPLRFFDAETGDLIHELDSPRNTILSLNEVNSLGDLLASGSGQNLYLWDARKREPELPKRGEEDSTALSSDLRNILRGEETSTSKGRKRRHDGNDDTNRRNNFKPMKKTKSDKKK